MEDLEISDMRVEPCVNSRFIKPSRVVFKQNGCQRTWDYVREHDDISVLILNTSRQSFLLVKQFRPAVYMHVNRKLHQKPEDKASEVKLLEEDVTLPLTAPANEGVTYELCAGIVDKNVSLTCLARQEILEECGYEVPEDKIQRITSFRNGIGTVGSLQTLFYTEVEDEMQVSIRGGNIDEGERIELFYLPVEKLNHFLLDESKHKPADLLFAASWWLNKYRS